jgi:RNA polymerase sigma-70 factor (ECF subfamily)
LNDDQREAVLLKVYQGFKFEEMAEILGCPVSTVKSRLYTALDLLKITLAPAVLKKEVVRGEVKQ